MVEAIMLTTTLNKEAEQHEHSKKIDLRNRHLLFLLFGYFMASYADRKNG